MINLKVTGSKPVIKLRIGPCPVCGRDPKATLENGFIHIWCEEGEFKRDITSHAFVRRITANEAQRAWNALPKTKNESTNLGKINGQRKPLL